jgi:hypothetical protein
VTRAIFVTFFAVAGVTQAAATTILRVFWATDPLAVTFYGGRGIGQVARQRRRPQSLNRRRSRKWRQITIAIPIPIPLSRSRRNNANERDHTQRTEQESHDALPSARQRATTLFDHD